MTDISIQSEIERFKRRMRRISEGAILHLSERQFFQPPSMRLVEHVLDDPISLLDQKTPIGSMGSCFAREIKTYLVSHDYNYVNYGEGERAQHGSAPWERVFNPACIFQEVRRALESRSSMPEAYVEGADGRIYDLCRKKTSFASWCEATKEEADYIEKAVKALTTAEVFIFTLGLSEVWHDVPSGLVLAEAPPQPAYDSDRHDFGLLSPDEVCAYLRQAFDLLLKKNPKVKIILTVSPVPLRATFFDRSALTSNNVSKGILLYGAHVMSREYENVWYFPSYEITQHLVDDPFDWDGRHVRRETVQLIMESFVKMFGSA